MLFHLPAVSDQRLFELYRMPQSGKAFRIAISEEIVRRADEGELKQSTLDSKTFKFIR